MSAADDDSRFPAGFCWGVATSAFQIEGAWNSDGKGPSVWDTLAHRPGGLTGGATGDIACDHYHRLEEDLDLLGQLGVTSYRFSVSWPRVQPAGAGAWNQAGLAFYDRLLDGLLERGIQPTLTVYHWDHPQPIEDRGGWTDRDTAHRFADYAAGLARAFGDRVTRWITLNEPLSVTMAAILGHERPAGALGAAGIRVAHHLLLAHGLAVQAIRGCGVSGEVGITLNLAGFRAALPSDTAAAHRARVYEDRLFLDPLLHGQYPCIDGQPVVESTPADLELIAVPLDFLGVNWYAPGRISDGPDTVLGYTRAPIPGTPVNMLGWPIHPESLGDLLTWLRASYPRLPPVYITENGIPLPDRIAHDGTVLDAQRIDYLRRCLIQIRQAIADGMDIRGYYAWSLMDNLEWSHGYGPRFGLIHVDFETLTRTPKHSYHWYRRLIAHNRGGEARCGG